jgi:hypothetical protein
MRNFSAPSGIHLSVFDAQTSQPVGDAGLPQEKMTDMVQHGRRRRIETHEGWMQLNELWIFPFLPGKRYGLT